MSSDPAACQIRLYAGEADIARILELRSSVEAVDQEGIPVNEAVLRAQLNLPGHNPLRDRWVIELPGQPDKFAGYCLVQVAPGADVAEMNIIVHPDWRGKGLEEQLLERLLQRAHQLGASRARFYVTLCQPHLPPILRQIGFSPLGAYTEMRAAGDLRLPAVFLPYGYTLRTFAQNPDPVILTQLYNECYADQWGHHPVNQAEMIDLLQGFDYEGLFMVFSEKNRPVGVSRVEISPERTTRNGQPTGFIDSPGIYPPHRRMDLYKALLITGMRWLTSQGQQLIELESWGDRKVILDMYQEIGFTIMRQETAYESRLG